MKQIIMEPGSWGKSSIFVELYDFEQKAPESLVNPCTRIYKISNEREIVVLEKIVNDCSLDRFSGRTMWFGAVYVYSAECELMYKYKINSTLDSSIEGFIKATGLNETQFESSLYSIFSSGAYNVLSVESPCFIAYEFPESDFERLGFSNQPSEVVRKR